MNLGKLLIKWYLLCFNTLKIPSKNTLLESPSKSNYFDFGQVYYNNVYDIK